MKLATALIGALLLALLPLAGCTPTREQQLAAVAKDWSLTIRASQVIPVYPMTEDLQVGDVFLVQRTVTDQHEAYTARGFLAMENHIARLQPSRYDGAYGNSFFKNDELGGVMPRQWLTPGEATSFDRAPGAAFPAYTFSVSSGQGFAAALPIQAVPVGLSLMNSDSATGSVTLKDARTYGIPLADLLVDIQAWAAKNERLLEMYGSQPEKPPSNYVRVVSRVYMVGKVNVTLNDTRASSGGLSVGTPKPVELPLLKAAKTPGQADVDVAGAETYQTGLASINKALEASAAKDAAGNLLPGATVKVVASSAKSVSIDETFKRPVVIGYLGFDMAVLDGGRLGPPCPTYAVLEHRARPVTQPMRDVGTFRAIDAVASMDGDPDQARAAQIRDAINKAAAFVLPDAYPVAVWGRKTDGTLATQRNQNDTISRRAGAYRALVTYTASLDDSVTILTQAVAENKATPQQRADLETTKDELLRINAASATIELQLRKGAALLGR